MQIEHLNNSGFITFVYHTSPYDNPTFITIPNLFHIISEISAFSVLELKWRCNLLYLIVVLFLFLFTVLYIHCLSSRQEQMVLPKEEALNFNEVTGWYPRLILN